MLLCLMVSPSNDHGWHLGSPLPYRVGQSREIYSNSVPLSPPHWPYPKCIRPPSWPRVAVASSIQNTKLFTWRTWPGAGAVPKCDWAAQSRCGAPITQSTFDKLRRMANPLFLLNWWLHNMITKMTMHYFKCNRMENDNILLSHTCGPANWHAHR